jgi:hypothetical protein
VVVGAVALALVGSLVVVRKAAQRAGERAAERAAGPAEPAAPCLYS